MFPTWAGEARAQTEELTLRLQRLEEQSRENWEEFRREEPEPWRMHRNAEKRRENKMRKEGLVGTWPRCATLYSLLWLMTDLGHLIELWYTRRSSDAKLMMWRGWQRLGLGMELHQTTISEWNEVSSIAAVQHISAIWNPKKHPLQPSFLLWLGWFGLERL